MSIAREKLKKYRKNSNARVATFNSDIARWIEPYDGAGDPVSMTVASFELALDSHVEAHGLDGFDLIEIYYRKALQRSRGSTH